MVTICAERFSVPANRNAVRTRTRGYLLCISAVLYLLLCPTRPAVLNAATDIVAKTSFSTGWLRAGGDDLWITGASAKLDFSTAPTAKIKAYISAVYNYTGAGSGYLHSASIDKAYFKMRIPWINDSFIRLSAGKQPISWGYGSYFNAADSIFGSEPAASGLGDVTSANLDSLRALTDWMITAYIPLGSSVFAELVVLPPASHAARTGGRISADAGWGFLETAELSYLVSFPKTAIKGFSDIWSTGSGFSGILPAADSGVPQSTASAAGGFAEHTIAAALDGTVYADWTLAAAGTIAEGVRFSETIRISASIFKNWNIPADTREVPVSFRTEILWYPIPQKVNAFLFGTVGVADSVSAGVMCITAAETGSDFTGSAGITVSWQPAAGLELSVSGMSDFTAKTAACTVGGSYKF